VKKGNPAFRVPNSPAIIDSPAPPLIEDESAEGIPGTCPQLLRGPPQNNCPSAKFTKYSSNS